MRLEDFVEAFVAHLNSEAVTLRSYGAEAQATTCEKNAASLTDRFRQWWLENLTIAEAANECGYAEESLRSMAREGKLPHSRMSDGGPMSVRRCDLPHRPSPRQPEDSKVTSIAERLLGSQGGLRKPA
jgi:hypothetical protein